MLYNLFILKRESGISLGKIDFLRKFTDPEADFISAGIQAILDFFKGLQFGELESFQFHDKYVLISRGLEVTLILICSIDSDLKLYRHKLELISVMYEESFDWCKWYGDISAFREYSETAKNILLDE